MFVCTAQPSDHSRRGVLWFNCSDKKMCADNDLVSIQTETGLVGLRRSCRHALTDWPGESLDRCFEIALSLCSSRQHLFDGCFLFVWRLNRHCFVVIGLFVSTFDHSISCFFVLSLILFRKQHWLQNKKKNPGDTNILPTCGLYSTDYIIIVNNKTTATV